MCLGKWCSCAIDGFYRACAYLLKLSPGFSLFPFVLTRLSFFASEILKKIFFAILLRLFIFKSYSQKIKVCFLNPTPIVERFLALYILIFVKNYHMGLNNPRTPPRWGSQNWTKNGGVYVGS